MNYPKLPAGLDKNSTELYLHDGALMALYDMRMISFWSLPWRIIKVFWKEMDNSPGLQRKFGIEKMENSCEKLEEYIKNAYGIFDNIPDYIEGKTNKELGFDEACTDKRITQREKEVIVHISAGCTDKQIAARLNISPKTVEKHRHNIHQKINSRNACGITQFAMNNTLADLG
jgi:DNA-binding CsgD family transcriptional regulator